MPKEKMGKIKQELSNSNKGWDFRQVMDLIQKRTGVRTMKCTSEGCFTSGAFHQRLRGRGL